MFLLVMSFCAAVAYAQDVIIKRDATKIEAVIQEVSKDEIRYKNYSNQSGPTFVLSTDDISSIIYSNGDVQVFEQKVEKPVQYENSQKNNPVGGTMTYMGGQYYLNNEPLTETEFRDHLLKNCMPAYEYYKKQIRIGISGTILLGIGLGMLVGGASVIETSWDVSFWSMVMSTVPIAIGVPLCAAGFSNRKKACKVYNLRCGNSAYNRDKGIRLDFQSTSDGLGFALKF